MPFALIAIAFLAGSIPFGFLIARARGLDIRAHGSGNIGATNVARVLGPKLGALCFALDLLKGLLPTLAAGWALGALGHWSPEPARAGAHIAVMLAAVLGHVFCPWLGFKGGKGVATGLGALLGLFPVMTVAALGALAVWIIAAKARRYVSLASILAGLSLPLWVAGAFVVARSAAWLSHESPDGAVVLLVTPADVLGVAWPFLALALLLAAFVLYTHRSNIARLRAGTEPRIGDRARAKTPDNSGGSHPA